MQLEEELGAKLFVRGQHSISLTEEGMFLRRRAQEIIDLAEKTKTEMARLGFETLDEYFDYMEFMKVKAKRNYAIT